MDDEPGLGWTESLTAGLRETRRSSSVRAAVIVVAVALEAEEVVLTYTDTAPAFDPFASIRRPDAEAPLEARTAGGLGIFFITEIASRYAYTRVGDRNCITMVLRRPHAGGAPRGS